jgi:hypothetical protein
MVDMVVFDLNILPSLLEQLWKRLGVSRLFIHLKMGRKKRMMNRKTNSDPTLQSDSYLVSRAVPSYVLPALMYSQRGEHIQHQ